MAGYRVRAEEADPGSRTRGQVIFSILFLLLVVFSDVDIDAWYASGEPQEPKSARKHSLSDGFAFVGWRTGSGE